MSTLVLVRHGQAAPFQKESDVLSPVGEQQARALAGHWLASGEKFDEVYTGTLVRQQKTEATVAAAFREAGVHWPRAQPTPAWNEYDAQGVLSVFAPSFPVLVADFENARGTSEQNRHFQRLLEAAMMQWLRSDELQHPPSEGGPPGPRGVPRPRPLPSTISTWGSGESVEGVEPFHSFDTRVGSALAAIMGKAGSRRVAVFTSGGPIGLLVQRTLKAPPKSFLDVHWRVRNASLTEFIYSNHRISLDSFNSTHFLPKELITYR